LKIYEIKDLVLQFENDFNSSEIMLQVGFQGYPTKIEDSGISKIDILKNKFDNKIIFADHIDGNTEDSLWLPIFASSKNIFGIEKHVKHSSLETKYDFYSSIDVKKYKKFIDIINVYSKLNSKTFISDEEDLYLVKSDQKPILKVNKKKGDLLSWDDFTFKRSNSKGLNARELNKYIGVGYCLTRDLNINDSINDFNLKKVTTATIVAARLKSSRLKRKALLKIGNLSSIEYCLKNALKFNDINFTVLATSNLDSDDELKHETFNSQVIFRKGDPHDVVKRYLDIIDELKIDVVVRVTGDMPFVSNDILQILLKSHYNSGADYTVGKDAAVGTNLEIINSAALIEVKKHFKSADYSEYMSWYFQNNPDYFKLNFVELPDYLIRNYRLTLDYQEDLDMFNIVDKHFTDNDLEGNVTELFNFLDENPEVSELNNHITLKYKTDQDLIKKLNESTKINAV
jgi:spore coat polysaccharide biosynthesis protein SpsF (cytidylyltransferase family)